MRSSYFLLFTLAAILPGLMLGAVLSRATLGTAAGPSVVQSQPWSPPLEAGLQAAVPAAPTGFDRTEFGTNDLQGSSEQNALALLLGSDGGDIPAMAPQAPSDMSRGQASGLPAPLALPQPSNNLPSNNQPSNNQLATAPRLPAPLPLQPTSSIDSAITLPTGLPEPLSLSPTGLPALRPLTLPTPQSGAAGESAGSLPEAQAASNSDASPGLRGSAVEDSTQALSEPLDLASLSASPLEGAQVPVGAAAALSSGLVMSADFDPADPQSWLEGVESTDYRPPQFVLLSFEAASRNVFWDTSRELAGEADAKVTYFISASSLVLEERAEDYATPTGEKGRAWLGFAKDREELSGRLQRIQDALAAGHDVAVQGVGYHRGQGWSIDQWRSELEQTEAFVLGAYRDNGLSEPANWPATAQHLLTGFRAREQSGSSSLETALVARKQARYNASGKQVDALWPTKDQGLWQLGLPLLNLDGGRRVLAQDYDFYLKQTNGQPNGAKSGDHEEQMLALLLAEFDARYQAGRAPMPVSLHFALWNKGAYWRAVKRFAKKVCGQPEVVCTTHGALVSYLEALGQAKLARLAAADFPAYQGPGVQTVAPASGLALPQIASLNKSASLRAEQAASTAARLLGEQDASPTPVQASYIFDSLPQGQGAPLPATKPRRIAERAGPAPEVVPSPPQKQAAAPKQVEKPLPLPFAATNPNASSGTRSAETDVLY